MASSPRDVAQQFYGCFQKKDGAGMAALYAPEATFADSAFPGLDGAGAGAMWRMLTGRGADLAVVIDALDAVGDTATVKWTATYSFGPARRPVVNHVTSTLRIEGGLIRTQVDVFDFPVWAAQALGLPGKLFGRFAFMQRAVQRGALAQLASFRKKNG